MAKKKKNGIGKRIAIVVVCGLLGGGMLAGVPAGYSYYKSKTEQKAAESGKTPEETDSRKEDLSATELGTTGAEDTRISSVYDVSVVWDNVIPAMVEIQIRQVESYQFFGRVYEEESEGSGTGIIIGQSDELFLVTNHHVVDGATAIQVTFVDGATASAEVKGTNEKEDIAVLSVKLSELSDETLQKIRVATIGDSDALTGGEMVIAIGNAAGGGQSLTVGYVSAVDREVEIGGVAMRLIQTDAAINPGNSGGALLNARGELIGINNAKLVATKVEGVGYSIPISSVLSLIKQLASREEIDYEDSAVLGIEGKDVTDSLSTTLNIPKGVYIANYTENSAAEAAGIPLYSVITEVNGIGVETMEQLKEILAYIRGGSEGTITVQEREQGEYVPKEYKVTFGVKGE